MNIYFAIIIGLCLLSIGVNMSRDGEPKDDNYSTLNAIFNAVIIIGLTRLAIKAGF